MYRVFLAIFAIVALASVALAEPITITVAEPIVAGNNMQYSEVEYCTGAGCTNWIPAGKVPASAPGGNCAGAACGRLRIDIPFASGDDITVRVRTRAVTTSNNRGAWSPIFECVSSC